MMQTRSYRKTSWLLGGGTLATIALLGTVALATWSSPASHDVHANSNMMTGVGWRVWKSAGSEGTVDERDLGMHKFSSGRVSMNNSVTSGKLNIRYNINLFEYWEFPTNNDTRYNFRYKDNGENARVRIKLKEYNMDTGVTRALQSWDSDDYPQLDTYQNQWLFNDAPSWNFNPDNIYFFDVQLIRNTSDGNPALGGLVIYSEDA